MTVVGTRPEIVRLSRVMLALDAAVDSVVVHTGQNWDAELSYVFFKELGLRQPDRWLGVDTTSLGTVLGGVLVGMEAALHEEKPDAVLILGDTNSCIAGLMAKRLGIPVFHMEAGNRSFDENVPEETNRRMIDHVADFNLCYTEHARRNLLTEGFPTRRVFVTGSPLSEVLAAYDEQIEASSVLDRLNLEAHGYFVVSMHREENVDVPGHLDMLLAAFRLLQQRHGLRMIVSTHPRLRRRLAQHGSVVRDEIELLDPFGYLDYNKLQRNARCVLSDSGTISEESAITGFPAVTIRRSMERPEALDSGSIVIAGVEPQSVQRGVELVMQQWDDGVRPSVPTEYRTLDCSTRVTRLIIGLSGLHAQWLGLVDKARNP